MNPALGRRFRSPVGCGLARLLLGSLAGPSLVALALLTAAGCLLQLAAALLGSAALPSWPALLRLTADLLPAVLELGLPLAIFAGALVGFGRWREDGTWTGLRAIGLPGRRLLGPSLLLGGALAVVLVLLGHGLAPAGRRAAARTLAESAGALELVPGHFLAVGDAVLHRPEGGGLLVALGDLVAVAREHRIEPRSDGVLLRLADGRAALGAPGGGSLGFREAAFPLPSGSPGRRVELAERSDAELRALAASQQRNGKDSAYTSLILLKRSMLPIVALWLPLLACPMGLRWGARPWMGLSVVLGLWTLIRAGDACCRWTGAWAAAALPLLGLGVCAALVWLRWEDR